MLSTQKERENFYRISTIIVDHGKESLILLLENELKASNQTLEDFINLNQHELYHLCFNRYACCQCKNGKLPLTTPASRVLHPDQLNILLDKSGQQLPCHTIRSSLQFCCCPAKSTLTTKHLDLTLLRCLLINFASICPPNSNIRLAVDDLIGYRNKLYGHAQEAKCSETDYILYKSQIETVILTIAKSCNKEREMKQRLKDAEVRPLDETICQQYQNCLLFDIQRNEDIKTEIKRLDEQSRKTEGQVVQCILETNNTITTNISSLNKTITNQIEGMHLDVANRDEILYERIQSMEAKVNDEVSKQTKDIMRTIETEKEDRRVKHEELIEHIQQTEHSIRTKTDEKTENILTKVEESRQDIDDKILNLGEDFKEAISSEAGKLGKIDVRKQNLIDHSNAIIQCHVEDETFVKTYALEKGRSVLKEENLLFLLAKGGSGKTQIARRLASIYKDEGYVPLFFSDKDVIKYRDLISLDEKHVVIVEDLFGRINVDFYEDDHRNILDILSNCLKKSSHLKMIFTIRNDPKCEENILTKHNIFHKKCILNLDNDLKLSDKERILILLSHMKCNSIIPCKSPVKVDIWFDYNPIPCCSSECSADVIKLSNGSTQICTDILYTCCMCDTFLGFPETCRMFCSDETLTFLGMAYFHNTNKSLVDKINALFSKSFDTLSCRYQYCVLVYTALKCNFLDNNILGSHIENDELFRKIFSIFDDKETKIRKTLVQQAIRELEGGYLIKSSQYSEFHLDCTFLPSDNAYMIKHQAVCDAVLVSFGNECSEILLDMDICDLGFLLNYIRLSIKPPDANSSVIHVNPKLVLDKLFHIVEKEISFHSMKLDNIISISHPWRPMPIDDEDDVDDNDEQRKCDERGLYENTNDANRSHDEQAEEICSKKRTDDVHVLQDLQTESLGSNTDDINTSLEQQTEDLGSDTDDINTSLDLQTEDLGSDTDDINTSLDLQTEGLGSDTDDINTSLDLQTEDGGSDEGSSDDDYDEYEDQQFSENAGRFLRHDSEQVGEYIRKCIIEKKYASFIKTFLGRLSKLSPPPLDQITRFLNGLTRRGTCLMNLAINSDIIRDFALDYADISVLCLLFRPESSNVKHCKFYKLDDKSLQDKLFAIIEGNKKYKIIIEIGKFLYRMRVEQGNDEFVNRFLDKVLGEYQNRDNLYKIRYLIDGMSSKGKQTDIVSHFKEFMQKYLLAYGSIKAIIGLWEVLNTETFQSSQPQNNPPLMVVLEDKFRNHMLFGTDVEHGVDYKIQTQEYGACVFNLCFKVQDNKCIEELIFKLDEMYKTSIRGQYLLKLPNNVHFLSYFYKGFTNFKMRKDEALKLFPLGMETLICHTKRYKAFLRTVREAKRHQLDEDDYFEAFVNLLKNLNILDPNISRVDALMFI
ncbi:Hypothetical predicted protein [Mytilus galloprovincialis]|uniref:Novel STAND NTPase 3 domain-containing protein n=1 Tax=Mytilus galloprovincialis TaxID=29158 RepID=A0A8B6EW63_MYTGA|nr:Hypothetical predicted protein [Mytilus galloprovincialis]